MKKSMQYFQFFFLIILFNSFFPVTQAQQSKKNTLPVTTTVDKEEALKAFNYINEVRANPAKYSKSIGVNLNNVKPKPALVWNDTLAKVAEAKAADMAKRKYFAHVNPDGEGINVLIYRAGYSLPKEWIKDKKANNFESLQAGGTDAIDAVNDLIIDEGEPRLGHRKHLLGIEDWNANLKDIGIGFIRAPGSEYRTYICIIIAKHDW